MNARLEVQRAEAGIKGLPTRIYAKGRRGIAAFAPSSPRSRPICRGARSSGTCKILLEHRLKTIERNAASAST